MVTSCEANYLREAGWKEQPSNVPGQTCWLAPVGNALYYALDAAYALEAEGDGVYGLLGQQALTEALEAEDRRRMDETEAARFAATGIRLGFPPNY
jgi:hypothetical protein